MADEADQSRSVGAESVLEKIEERSGTRSRVLLHDESGEHSPVVTVAPGSRLRPEADGGRFQILGEIGRGGVGVIYKSLDRDLGRNVALKVLREEHADRPEVVERFIEEAQVGGQLQHPGIVPIYGLGLNEEGRPFFAMKLVKGKTLAVLLSDRPEPGDGRRRFLNAFEQICQTMAYAHSRGVIHRDLKPANIMVGAFGELQIMDWGFAKVFSRKRRPPPTGEEVQGDVSVIATLRSGEEGSPSIAGSVMGTPAYMPPEQAMGRIDELDERTDVFALGAILAEILTGHPPYAGSDQLVQAARGHLEEAFSRLDECGADEELVALAKRCLSAEVDGRPADAGEVAETVSAHLAAVDERAHRAELEAVRARAEAEERRQAAVEQRTRVERERALEEQARRKADGERRAKRRTTALAAAALLAVLIGGGAFLLMRSARAARAREFGRAVGEAVEEATVLGMRKRWDDAVAAAENAIRLAGRLGADEPTTARARAVLADLEDGRAKAEAAAELERRDARMLETLERAGSWVITQSSFLPLGQDPRSADREYERAFRRDGIDVLALDKEESIRRIRSRSIAAELTAALDDWIWLRRVALRLPEAQWRPLVEIANRVEGDGKDDVRVRLREAAHARDVETLRELADRAVAEELPEGTCAAVGRALLEEFAPADAAAFLEKARRLYPDSIRINHYLAGAALRFRPADANLALRCRAAVVARRPSSPEAWWHLGNAWLMAREFDEAISAYGRALELDPRHGLSHIQLGVALGMTLDHDAAVARYRESVGVEPVPVRFYLGLAHGLMQGGKPEAAVRAARGAADREPENALNQLVLADLYLMAGRYDEALETAEEAIPLAPDSYRGYATVAKCHARKEEGEKALAAAREALAHGPPLPHRLAMLEILHEHAKPPEAIAAIRETLETAPNLTPLHRRLAEQLLEAGDYAAATESFATAIRLSPGDPSMRNDAAWQIASSPARETDAVHRAVEWAREAVAMSPGEWALRNTLGVCEYRAGLFEEAVRTLERAVRMDASTKALDAYFLAMACHRAGREEAAAEWLRKGDRWFDPRNRDEALEGYRREARELVDDRTREGGR